MEKAKESLVISWCDNGNTDSLFTSSFGSLLMSTSAIEDIEKVGINQTIGNQIARQRGDAIRNFEQMDCDWMLWIDSDIVVTHEAFKLLWEARDAEKRPLVSGVYFISYEMNMTLPAPVPCIFTMNDKGANIPVHPLPESEIIPIQVAGLGFTLMHKSVAKKLRDAFGETTFQIVIGNKHVSEDVAFFDRCREVGIQPYAHTGAHVQHIKRFSLDRNYYNLWWNVVAPMREAQEKANDNNI